MSTARLRFVRNLIQINVADGRCNERYEQFLELKRQSSTLIGNASARDGNQIHRRFCVFQLGYCLSRWCTMFYDGSQREKHMLSTLSFDLYIYTYLLQLENYMFNRHNK